jgi:hypothetical protein
LLWRFALALTTKGVPAGDDAGVVMITLDTLMSEVARMFTVFVDGAAQLFPAFGSVRPGLVSVMQLVMLNTCAEGAVQEALKFSVTFDATDCVSVAEVGFPPAAVIVQSGGPLTIGVMATFAGVAGPLLCRVF